MGWFTKSDPDEAERKRESIRRGDAWGTALNRGTLPDFIEARLKDAAAKRTPWLSTLTPAELLLARSHGVRPVATVSGTCWFHYGWSWTEGHAEGWHTAIARMKQEAIAAGANAILDVKLRTVRIGNTRDSMDYTVLGTAVSIDGLPPSRDPVVATVPAIEFVRLLEAGIVTVGVAIGARYDWLTASTGTFGWLGMNGNCGQLTTFWEDVRRQALADLRRDTARLGDGVLAHTHFGQLLKVEGGENTPSRVLGRHIVLGTAVQCGHRDPVPHDIRMVVDMRDDLSPLDRGMSRDNTVYGEQADQEGLI